MPAGFDAARKAADSFPRRAPEGQVAARLSEGGFLVARPIGTVASCKRPSSSGCIGRCSRGSSSPFVDSKGLLRRPLYQALLKSTAISSVMAGLNQSQRSRDLLRVDAPYRCYRLGGVDRKTRVDLQLLISEATESRLNTPKCVPHIRSANLAKAATDRVQMYQSARHVLFSMISVIHTKQLTTTYGCSTLELQLNLSAVQQQAAL
jgi:hypothetical protein